MDTKPGFGWLAKIKTKPKTKPGRGMGELIPLFFCKDLPVAVIATGSVYVNGSNYLWYTR